MVRLLQINYTDEERCKLKMSNWEKDTDLATKHKIYTDLIMGGMRKGREDSFLNLAKEGIEKGLFYNVADIETDSLGEAFEIGNLGPEEKIKRKGRMHSISVGDILIDDVGIHLVDNFGFTKLATNPHNFMMAESSKLVNVGDNVLTSKYIVEDMSHRK